MGSVVGTIFSGLFALLGINGYPMEGHSEWKVEKAWAPVDHGYQLILSSEMIAGHCEKSPSSAIVFPQVIHSYSEFWVDKQRVSAQGDPTFQKAAPFYERFSLPCSELKAGSKVVWKVTSYSRFFARFKDWPFLSSNPRATNFFSLSLNIGAFCILFILSFFTFLIYKGRVSDSLTYSVSIGSLLLSGYFLNASNSFFGIDYSMLTAHKLADSCLWLGGIFFIHAFTVDGMLNPKLNWLFRFSAILALVQIGWGSDGDQVQFGTMLPMVPFLLCSVSIVTRIFQKIQTEKDSRDSVLKMAAIVLFAAFGVNDALNVTGVIDTEMLLSIGLVGGVFGLSVAVNQEISKTYTERNVLLNSLELKVAEKTRHLEAAMSDLKSTQAELVQSARLASLGTMSAGIAHEINNSINYVNGALVPLERKLTKLLKAEDMVLIEKLLAAIKEGTLLTVKIVKSLRTYTGLNQAEFKVFDVKETVDSVLTILKSRTRNVQFDILVADDCKVFGNLVGFNQIFMNLISNSLDALDKPDKRIRIHGQVLGDKVQIEVEDNGSGIPQEIASRIFDPFFTTKEVGKGTGLGLHIVLKEIENHQGKLFVSSEVGMGTKFTIQVPITKVLSSVQEAA